MSKRKSFFLDQDERDMINCLIENSLIKQKLIKYASLHSHILEGKSFEYDKETGEVIWFEKGETKNET